MSKPPSEHEATGRNPFAIGAKVYFHSIIGRPHDGVVREIRSNPWRLGHGQWVVLVTGVSGGVALDAISPADARPEGTVANE